MKLTLDTPGASEALSQVYALLRRWAEEAEKETADSAGDFDETNGDSGPRCNETG